MLMRLRKYLLLVVPLLTVGFSLSASAGGVLRDDKTDSDWEILLTPYLWAAGLKGTSAVGTLPPLDIDASFSDLFDKLDFAFSLRTEFHRGKWAIVVDPTYLSLTIDAETPLEGVSPRIKVDIWFVEVWGSYKITPNWEIISGVRWQDQDISVSRLPSPPLPNTEQGVSDNWVDWFAGVRFKYALNEKWLVVGRADAALAGDSDSSYNVEAYVIRRVGKNKSLNVGYRYFEDDYDNTPKYAWDIEQTGPKLGFTWSF